MEDETCSICGENNEFDIKHKLSCGHTFHYKCLCLSFKHTQANRCPYCRSGGHFLPLVNGVKKPQFPIHKHDPDYINKKCEVILTRGPNKGNMCGKSCHLGYYSCITHLKQQQKKEKKHTNLKNMNKDIVETNGISVV